MSGITLKSTYNDNRDIYVAGFLDTDDDLELLISNPSRTASLHLRAPEVEQLHAHLGNVLAGRLGNELPVAVEPQQPVHNLTVNVYGATESQVAAALRGVQAGCAA